MGTSTSKEPEPVELIRRNTLDIRSSIKRDNVNETNKSYYHQRLIESSKQLNEIRTKESKKKQKEVDKVQKLVSRVSEELLRKAEENLDNAAEESHSFILVGPNGKITRTDDKVKKKTKTAPKVIRDNDAEKKLNEIEDKLKAVKNEVNVSLQNNSTNFAILKKKIQMLMTDLNLLGIEEDDEGSIGERNHSIEKDLYRYYQKIIKRERQLQRSSSLAEIKNVVAQKKEDINFYVFEGTIEELEDRVKKIIKTDKPVNVKEEFNKLDEVKKQLASLNCEDKSNQKQKTILLKKVQGLQETLNTFCLKHRSILLDKIKKIENDLSITKNEVNSLNKTSNTILYNILDTKLNTIKKSLEGVDDADTDIERKKLSCLSNIEEAQKVLLAKKEEVAKPTKAKEAESHVILRPKLKPNKSLNDLQKLYKNFENLTDNIKLSSKDEVKELENLLGSMQSAIDAKLKEIGHEENRVRFSDTVSTTFDMNKGIVDSIDTGKPMRVTSKIYELPKPESLEDIRVGSDFGGHSVEDKSNKSVNNEVAGKPLESKNPEPTLKHYETTQGQIDTGMTKALKPENHKPTRKISESSTKAGATKDVKSDFEEKNSTEFKSRQLEPKQKINDKHEVIESPVQNKHQATVLQSKPSATQTEHSQGKLVESIIFNTYGIDPKTNDSTTEMSKQHKKSINSDKFQRHKTDSFQLEDSSDKSNSISKRNTTDYALSEISQISEEVDKFREKVLNFKGTSEDLEYNFIMSCLLTHKNDLKAIQISPKYSQVVSYWKDVMDKIDTYIQNLKYQLQENCSKAKVDIRAEYVFVPDNVKQLDKKIKNLKEKVNRFSGSYKNVLYRQIEKELLESASDADEVANETLRKHLKQDILKSLSILEEKSDKNNTNVEKATLDDQQTKIALIISKIAQANNEIKFKIDNPLEHNVVTLLDLEAKLNANSSDLRNLNLKQHEPFYNESIELQKQLSHLHNALNAKIKNQRTGEASEHLRYSHHDVLNAIEDQLIPLEKKVTEFVGVDESHEFRNLETELTKLSITVDKLVVPSNDYIAQQLKTELMRKINNTLEQLDAVAIETEEVQRIEEMISKIFNTVEKFSSEDDYNKLDESLINLKIRLEKFQVCPQLLERKNTCINFIQYCLKTLYDKYNNLQAVSDGVLV